MAMNATVSNLDMAVGSIVLALISAGIYIFFISPAAKRRRLELTGLRGPKPEFPLGNMSEMGKKNRAPAPGHSTITHDIHSTIFPYFSRWRESYGKVFVYWMGTEPFIYVADPDFLSKMTAGTTNSSWGKPNMFRQDRRPLFGEGMVMIEGENWAHHRRIITPAFSSTNQKYMLDVIVESASAMVEEWSSLLASGRREIDAYDHLTRTTGEIIVNIVFGVSDNNGKEVFWKLKDLKLLLFRSKRLLGVPFSRLFHLRQTLASEALGKETDKLLLSIVESRKAAMDSEGARASVSRGDLLGLLLEWNQMRAEHDTERLTASEIIGECKTFLFGGHETTSVALTWTLLLLALHPEWQTILREEAEALFAGASLDYSVLAKLVKMRWVMNEAMRLYPPSPIAQRQAREGVRVGEVVIPKGTNVWVDIPGMHHDPDLWGSDVNEFRPERFSEGPHGGCAHRMGFLPFGFGGRLCIAWSIAISEYKILLSLILRRFSLALSPSYVHSPSMMLSLRPSHGVPLILTPLPVS